MNKPKAPRLVTVAVFTTITIIFWVFMGLYNLITSKPPANVDPELLKPINPTLEQEALNRLENRVFFEPGQTSSPFIIREIPESTSESEEVPATEEKETSVEVASPAAVVSEQ
jgi:hypothetical protein